MKRIQLLAACVLLFCGTTALADYIDEAIKWSQLPILLPNMDVMSMHPPAQNVADDWLCTDPHAIIAARWWGSYNINGVNDSKSPNIPNRVPFEIVIHASNFPQEPHPNSSPQQGLYVAFVWAQEYEIDMGGWFIYRYDAYLPSAFYQETGTEYFFSVNYDTIMAPLPGTGDWWGWHATNGTILDYAHVTLNPANPHSPPWGPIEPDRAFELMVPEPGTIALIGFGLAGLAGVIRKRMLR